MNDDEKYQFMISFHVEKLKRRVTIEYPYLYGIIFLMLLISSQVRLMTLGCHNWVSVGTIWFIAFIYFLWSTKYVNADKFDHLSIDHLKIKLMPNEVINISPRDKKLYEKFLNHEITKVDQLAMLYHDWSNFYQVILVLGLALSCSIYIWTK